MQNRKIGNFMINHQKYGNYYNHLDFYNVHTYLINLYI